MLEGPGGDCLERGEVAVKASSGRVADARNETTDADLPLIDLLHCSLFILLLSVAPEFFLVFM